MLLTSQSEPIHFSDKRWAEIVAHIREVLARRAVHPTRCVVLVPYAQLMQRAREAWVACGVTSFMPRFETTMNWANRLHAARGSVPGVLGGVAEASPDDIQSDAACDWLTAAALLERSGLGSHKEALAGRLVEAAWSLGGVAAAVEPTGRSAWASEISARLATGLEAPVLALEAALGQIALAWVSTSAYPTDLLFSAEADLLVVLDGFQADPLIDALRNHWGERAVSLSLVVVKERGQVSLHTATDAEDEAQRGAACVLARLAQGCEPVALIAQDRVLTRRIRAMLGERGISVRDETGWKLSTTRAAAGLMGLLRAAVWDASADTVLDWLKNAPAFRQGAVARAEAELRKVGVRHWGAVSPAQASAFALAEQVKPLLLSLRRSRTLAQWLHDLRAALRVARQWEGLILDLAGQACFDALRLHEGQEAEFDLSVDGSEVPPVMTLKDFSGWVNQTLEAASYFPKHPPRAQVVILPLSQLLGRTMQAVVLPGADEVRLPVSPEQPGLWTPRQRELLGLPSREATATAARAAWDYALQLSPLDLLWRTSEAGERIMPSGFVQELLLAPVETRATTGHDARVGRSVQVLPTEPPAPVGKALPVTRLSASAYEDLRRCPYRFFALRQLKLQESDELESELSKRDFGNWLHHLLSHFHLALKDVPDAAHEARLVMINAAAAQATLDLGLSQSEFLPFAAAWPRVREGYLGWLADHEAGGAVFREAEEWKEMPLGDITIFGKVDRLDSLPGGETLVIDYKTEPRGVTADRIKDPQEDTQLAFYAALLPHDTLAAAYVNLGEKDPTRTYAQEDIVSLREQLIESIQSDMTRILEGASLSAMGEGKACGYCAARGLCRKDFWSVS